MLRSPEEDNVVTSFEVGIVIAGDMPVGMCLKFVRWDRTVKVTHWLPPHYRQLLKALRLYHQTLGANAFMVRAHADSFLVARLPERHPYHSLLRERPTLEDDEAERLCASTQIAKVVISLRGDMMEIRPTFADGHKDRLLMHEYIALSLLSHLDEHAKAGNPLHHP